MHLYIPCKSGTCGEDKIKHQTASFIKRLCVCDRYVQL